MSALIAMLVRTLLFFCALLMPFIGHAGLGPLQTTSAEQIKGEYAAGTLSVLIVPGHDPINKGTQFGKGKSLYSEQELNVALAYHLKEYLGRDPKIVATVSREKTGEYSPWLLEYVEDHGQEILAFRRDRAAAMRSALAAGVVKSVEGVPHNVAENDTATYLYAVNKYANDNGIDIVLHVHFNDHGGRTWNEVGPYTGFSIYVPDKQFSNAAASKAVAESLRTALGKYVGESTLPAEAGGVLEDQELIAIGSNGTRDGVSVLVEYGYIYEPQLRSESVRRYAVKELAYQTYLGLERFLNPAFTPKEKLATTLLPHVWKKDLEKGTKGSLDVFVLQYALAQQGAYPPLGTTFDDCPINGNFGDCTEEALTVFQNKHLGYGEGYFGPTTRAKLGALLKMQLAGL